MRIAIAGAGIGGLSAALSLHAAGFDAVTLFEAAESLAEVGVGVNLPPHAVRELSELGLGDELADAGVPTAELTYYDRRGTLIWAEPRGLAAGYRWPQYSIHRGRLQSLLVDAVGARLGRQALRTGHRATRFSSADGAAIRLELMAAGSSRAGDFDLLIAADGIRSSLRDAVVGASVPLRSNGWTMFRGTTRHPGFLTGRSMAIIGDERQRLVAYPIGQETVNWLLVMPAETAAGTSAPRTSGELGNWNLRVDPAALAPRMAGWRFDWLDAQALVLNAQAAFEYPMADIDPLPRWVRGRAVLVGDAAHAMYPFGSNGASQAVLDARCLAFELATHGDPDLALACFEQARLPAASSVQLANRRQAGDVMARVSALARRSAHAAAAAELQAIEREYKKMAGFDVETLNARASFSARRRA